MELKFFAWDKGKIFELDDPDIKQDGIDVVLIYAKNIKVAQVLYSKYENGYIDLEYLDFDDLRIQAIFDKKSIVSW